MYKIALILVLFSSIVLCDQAKYVSISGFNDCKGTPCMLPGVTKTVGITLTNTGGNTWNTANTKLQYICSGTCFTIPNDLMLTDSADTGQPGTFTGSVTAPTAFGRHNFAFRLVVNGVNTTQIIQVGQHKFVEITCSDGVFCNGPERFVNGSCVAGKDPCDDGVACTIDRCDEKLGRCFYTNKTANCAICYENANCEPNCTGKACGDDNCGGDCGSCGTGQACSSDFTCVVPTMLGTCTNPIKVWTTQNSTSSLFATFVFNEDNSVGVNELQPMCNTHTKATEKIFYFEIPAGYDVGIDARVSGIDSVLEIRKGSCYTGKTEGCSDDATPPGNYGSRVAKLLDSGSYYALVDAYNVESIGPFEFSIKFVNGCSPQCEGKFCGNDSCGGVCGVCEADEYCSNTTSRCAKIVCVPDCENDDGSPRVCAEDGCGSLCGTCPSGELCVRANGSCQAFYNCDHHLPVCQDICGEDEYCGSDCLCYQKDQPIADLVIDQDELLNYIIFTTQSFPQESCAIYENCVLGTGARRLMKFNVMVVNQGFSKISPPTPSTRPDLFEWSECHAHYHFIGFADYDLLNQNGDVQVEGRKQGYCMLDTSRMLQAPHVPCSSVHDCNVQGILPGWGDLYSNDLDCQWIDITGVPPGQYQLRVFTNFNREFHEASFENNVLSVPVCIPYENGTAYDCSVKPATTTGTMMTTGSSEDNGVVSRIPSLVLLLALLALLF